MEGAIRAALWVLAVGFIFRLALALWLPLGLDEAYAVAVAREFSLSFFDHPPLGFWLGVVLADLTGIEHPGLYRLLFVALGTVTAVAVWRLGNLLGGPLAGFWALVLYTLAPHMALGSGVFVLPDAPMNAALAWMAVIIVGFAGRSAQPSVAQWCGVGALLALALASKYQAGLAAVAVFAWLLFSPRRRGWLLTPGPWLGAGVGLLGLLPALLWNLQNDWVSFSFHAGRTGGAADFGNLALMTIGQAIYLTPAVMGLALLGMWRAASGVAAADEADRGFAGGVVPLAAGQAPEGRGLIRAVPGGQRQGAVQVLLWMAGVPIVVFSLVYLFGTYTFPHWPMQGWLMALPLAGTWMAGTRMAGAWKPDASAGRVAAGVPANAVSADAMTLGSAMSGSAMSGRAVSGGWRVRAWLLGGAAPVWVMLLLAAVHLPTGILTRGMDQVPEWDRSLDLFDWRPLGAALEREGWLTGVEMLAAGDWISAGQMATALGGRLPMRVLSSSAGSHHFAHLSAADQRVPALYLVPDRAERIEQRIDEARGIAATAGATISRVGIIALPRAGRPHAAVGVLRLDWQ